MIRRSIYIFLAAICCPFLLLSQTANIAASVQSGCSPLVVNFDGTASTGNGLSYDWDFGNGNTTSGTNQQAPGAVYVTPGTYTASLIVTDANGNVSAPATQTIVVFDNPTADFAVSDTFGCPPLTVNFTDQSIPAGAPIASWTWDFGDGNSATQANPTHIYDEGSFDAALIVVDANGCQSVVLKTDLIETYPKTSLILSTNGPRQTCNASLTVSFHPVTLGQSAGPFLFDWDFGDGNTGTGPHPNHTYNGAGNYDVTVTITDQSNGCQFVHVEPDFVRLIQNDVSFTISDSGGCAPVTVQFTNTTALLEQDFIATWYFGNGDSLSGSATAPGILSPGYTYTNQGSYDVRLKIDMGPDLCVEEFIWPAAVVVTPEPVVDFTASDTVACAPPLTVNFQHLAPSATDFLWDFGDGNTATLPNPSHTYTAYGTYDVSLVVSNAQGCGNTLVKVGMIHIEPPQAAFIHDLDDNIVFPELWDGRDIDLIRGGCLPLDINFTDQSTSATPIVNWNWSFGDSTVLNDTLANPTHTYLTEGYFDVSLTITTADGCMSTVNCDSCIRAGNKPTALLDTTDYPLLQCCSAQSLFQNATQGNHDYVWYFVTTGDWDGFSINDTSNGNWDFGSTVPVFQDSGQFVSTMFYSYNFGCVDSFWLEDWTMLRPPYASAGIDTFKCQSNWPPGGTVIFDTSNTAFLLDTAYIDSVLWEFGDPNNSTSNEFYPTFTYPDTGAYWIGVTVWNFDNGCSCKTSGEQFLQIKVLPDTTFAINPNQGCAPLFVDISGPTDDVAAWDWYLGPGLTSTDQNPSFVLDSLGTYDVSLIVANAEGCADTVVQEDAIVVEGIDARLSVSDSLGCVPFSLTLADRSLSTSPIVSRTWDLGNGDVIMNNDSVITYTYTSAPLPPVMQLQGVPVVLSLTDSAGCVNSDTVWLRVIEPIPAYVADTVHRCDGDSLQLMALGGDSLGVSRLRYLWDFGGNDTSQSAMAERFFPTGGPHEISLTVTDSLGCRATRIDSIWVTPLLPTVDFSAFPIQATCPPLAVNFTDLSVAGSAPIVNWSWAFSDGGTSGLQNPARIFSAEGSYGVSLTITDSIGCTNTLDIPDLINLTGVLGDFVMSDDVICVNDSVLFTANSPNAGSYIWDFGDGTLGLGPMLYHTYYNAGLNIPTLIMKDSTNSCSKSLSDSLVVYPRPEVPMPPDIAFCDGGEVVLDVSYPGVEYRWNTGATHPMITVQNSGIFSVVLTDSITGCDADSSVEVLVHPLPEVSLGRDLQICEGDTVLLLAVSSDRIRDYRWNVSSLVPTGDDSLWVSPDRNLQIRTTVRDENGCMDRDSALITVVPFPEIDLTYEALCVGDTLVLDARPNNIPGNFGQYQWWQDGVPLGGNQAQLATTDSGTFEVLYRLDGCETMEGTEVYFNPLPVSNRYAEFLNCVYMGEPVQLDAGPYADYHWIHSGERTQSVGVVEAGRYYVDLFNIHGCATEDSFDIVDACPPKLYVPNAFTPNYDGHNEHFGWAGEYILEFHMMIFNRWGRKIYETRNYTDRWDGRFQGEVVPEGVYTYVVSWNGSHPAHRQMNQRAGTVTLYR